MAQSRKSSLALFIALALFGGIIYYAAQDRAVPLESHERVVAYGLDLDLKWLADADAADYAVVQDTLSFVADRLALAPGVTSMNLQLHGLEPHVWGTGATGFKAHLKVDMASPDLGPALLAYAVRQGYLSTHVNTPGNFGWTTGSTDLRLPMRQGGSAYLDIDAAAYSLRLAPRAAGILMENPEA